MTWRNLIDDYLLDRLKEAGDKFETKKQFLVRSDGGYSQKFTKILKIPTGINFKKELCKIYQSEDYRFYSAECLYYKPL